MNMTISSSAWVGIDVAVINNFDDSIKITEKHFIDEEKCFISRLKCELTEESAYNLFLGLKHMYNECDDDCVHCSEFDDDDD